MPGSKAWGFTFLRLLVTWEAVEHTGPPKYGGDPSVYDEVYLDYLRAVVQKAGELRLDVFIDPHQDVWSRFSGGDGAPGWTLEAAGLDMTHFSGTGAAITHQAYGDPFPKMIWPTNAASWRARQCSPCSSPGTTLPRCIKVDDERIQEYLQRHYSRGHAASSPAP